MSRLDAVVLAAGSIGLVANLALSPPPMGDGMPSPVARNAVQVQPLLREAADTRTPVAWKIAKR